MLKMTANRCCDDADYAGCAPDESVWPAVMNQKRREAAHKLFAAMGHKAQGFRELRGFFGADEKKGRVFLKDDSGFLGLGSFKGRGAIWAIANALAGLYGQEEIILEDLLRAARAEKSRVFVTATDGNHGKAVAFGARFFSQDARVFLPAGCADHIREAIAAQGASVAVCAGNYDFAVEEARKFAEREGAILLQDTAWPGYEQIPLWIMEGYGTLADEIFAHGPDCWPDYVHLQVGVGSFAAAMMANFLAVAERENLKAPAFVSLEPENAACAFHSIKAGRSVAMEGDLQTEMNGLACGKLSSFAWPLFSRRLKYACACGDEVTRKGMETLKKRYGIDSGPSGAVGAGFLLEAQENPEIAARFNPGATRLLISTEKNFSA